MRLQIRELPAVVLEVDEDVARHAGVGATDKEVPFTRARVLLEAQWLKHQWEKDLGACFNGPPTQEKQQTEKQGLETMKTNILLNEENDANGTQCGSASGAPPVAAESAPPAQEQESSGAEGEAGESSGSEEAKAE